LVVSFTPKAFTYNFAKAKADLKDWVEDNLVLGFLGLNPRKAFAWIIIVVESDMSNLDQHIDEELCLI